MRPDHVSVPARWARDETLSFRARGLLVLLHNWPASEPISLKILTRHTPEGVHSLRMTIAELERTGYLVRDILRGEGGKVTGVRYQTTNPEIRDPKS